MKLASFEYQGVAGIGIVSADNDSISHLNPLLVQKLGLGHQCSMMDLIEHAPDFAQKLSDSEVATAPKLPMASVQLKPPVRRPSKIICLALNNSANSDRIMKGPSSPAFFTKPASALIGHQEAIEIRPEDGRTHPEPELALIIGKGGKNIRAQDAYQHVFGYTAHNDITSVKMRTDDTFFYRAIHPKNGTLEIEYLDTWVTYSGRYKGTDTFSALGPWLVTADEISNPHDLDIACHHQGTLITSDNTQNLTHKTPEVIEYVSRYVSLWPGDVISLGTALKKSGGGGAVQNIDLFNSGGPVSVTIQKIGKLENRVKRLEPQPGQ
ncbi:fumarylacetoacetate hydrolase family protein [Ottowia thiooxydans]|uniref:fumarylacetoacetate hydrolase family protein n=1 Tax=Ottowia thiooxydans TaxID=219182 RepID=UPI00042A08AF|nr:fumarylacetoacetate hydrolase family protein [Ottowia thiooxydans]